MEPHSKEQLDQLRSFVDQQTEEYSTVEVGGTPVQYRIIHLTEEQRPFPYSVAAAVIEGDFGPEYEIAVSDDVPQQLRGLWAWHEYNDFAVVGHDADHRCATSERTLLNQLADEDTSFIRSYIQHRLVFYEQLAQFMQADIDRSGSESVYSSKDVAGCKVAQEFLRAQPAYELIALSEEKPDVN